MPILDLLLPASCAGCGRYGDPFCGACRRRLVPASRPRDRFITPDPGVVVGDAFEIALAAFAHEGVLRRALARLKYGGAARLAAPLGEAATPTLRMLLEISGPAVLVPVPVHRARERQRGYNQAGLLASALGRAVGLPVAAVLERQRETTKQHRLNRAARLRNLRGAFLVRAGARVPSSAIVVDDILTTSATLEACAQALREAGTRDVYGLAIAREV
jgi:ComF family protein